MIIFGYFSVWGGRLRVVDVSVRGDGGDLNFGQEKWKLSTIGFSPIQGSDPRFTYSSQSLSLSLSLSPSLSLWVLS